MYQGSKVDTYEPDFTAPDHVKRLLKLLSMLTSRTMPGMAGLPLCVSSYEFVKEKYNSAFITQKNEILRLLELQKLFLHLTAILVSGDNDSLFTCTSLSRISEPIAKSSWKEIVEIGYNS